MGNVGNQVGMQGIRVEMRGILLLLFIYFSLALQMIHKIINYNMTNNKKKIRQRKENTKRSQRVAIQNSKKKKMIK